MKVEIVIPWFTGLCFDSVLKTGYAWLTKRKQSLLSSKQNPTPLFSNYFSRNCTLIIGHVRVSSCICFNLSLSAKPFLWKWVWFAWKWGGTNFRINGFTWRLVLTKRQNATRKYPIFHPPSWSYYKSLASTLSIRIVTDTWLSFAGLHIHLSGGNDPQVDRV